MLPELERTLRELLFELKGEAATVFSDNDVYFSSAPVRLVFVSALADGADQIAAEIALDLGFELHAMLPFARQRARSELPDTARDLFDALLDRAAGVLELPGGEAGEPDAYVMAGRAIVAHSDVLIAVWDGEPPRGRGGTGDVVQQAFDRAVPVVHISLEPSAATRILWGAFEPVLVTRLDDPAAARPLDATTLTHVVTGLLAPPADDQEHEFIRIFQQERRRRLRPRIEYPLLLAFTGVASFRRHHWQDMSAAWTRAEWDDFRQASQKAGAVAVPISALQSWYEWADSLAGHFAQSHRSGHVFNFVLGAVAVLLGVSNLVLPHWSVALETALFLTVLSILANTWAANRQQWHRRWLDYRQLAERLRPMRSLELLGVAAPNPSGSSDPASRRWVEWYAAAVWRSLGCPSGRIDGKRLGALTQSIAEREIDPQVAYHRTAAGRAHRLHHRLEIFGTLVFAMALTSSVVLLTGFLIAPAWVAENYDWFTVLSAGLPAIGTAAVGIRVQGDHSASAARSAHTSLVLDQLANRLRGEDQSLLRAADLTERAAQTMLSDLNEWKLLTQQRGMSVG